MGNNVAVFDTYVPFSRVFNLTGIAFRCVFWPQIHNAWDEMMYIRKLWEIDECCGHKNMPSDFGVGMVTDLDRR